MAWSIAVAAAAAHEKDRKTLGQPCQIKLQRACSSDHLDIYHSGYLRNLLEVNRQGLEARSRGNYELQLRCTWRPGSFEGFRAQTYRAVRASRPLGFNVYRAFRV